MGNPVGKDSGINTWEGDQWKIGGGTTWGWYAYDPDLNLIYYGTGNHHGVEFSRRGVGSLLNAGNLLRLAAPSTLAGSIGQVVR